jgi:hypothetical protein
MADLEDIQNALGVNAYFLRSVLCEKSGGHSGVEPSALPYVVAALVCILQGSPQNPQSQSSIYDPPVTFYHDMCVIGWLVYMRQV